MLQGGGEHTLVVPLLPADNECELCAHLLRLRHALSTPLSIASAPASASTSTTASAGSSADAWLLSLIEAAGEALSSVDAESALSAAARPFDGLRDAQRSLVANQRLCQLESSGDETLTPSMLVPVFRRASRLACSELDEDAELGERLLTALGALSASLSGQGEYTSCVQLGGGRWPLELRHVGALSLAVRLGMGACAVGWAGVHVEGRRVLELEALGSGSRGTLGAVGLA